MILTGVMNDCFELCHGQEERLFKSIESHGREKKSKMKKQQVERAQGTIMNFVMDNLDEDGLISIANGSQINIKDILKENNLDTNFKTVIIDQRDDNEIVDENSCDSYEY